MSRRLFSPRSRQFNERLVKRYQNRYDGGLSRDLLETDLPNNTLAKLVNGRARRSEVEGRSGTEMITPADWGVSITDGSETLEVSIASGEMYAASGRNKSSDSVPSTNSKFMVYSDSDTSDSALTTAKGEAPRKYDVFQIDSSTTISYLGSVKLPALSGYGDSVSTEITASKSGTSITGESGPAFSNSLVGNYFEWGDGSADYISGYDSSTGTLTASTSGTKSSTSKCRIVPKINAQLYHSGEKRFVIQLGTRIYAADSVPWYSWSEIKREGSAYLPDDSLSEMYEFGKDCILVNWSGIYRIDIENSSYWRINDSAPDYSDRPADVSQNVFRANVYYNRYKYHYLYTFSRIDHPSDFTKDRYDSDSYFKWESGPTKTDETGKDYFEYWNPYPMGPMGDYDKRREHASGESFRYDLVKRAFSGGAIDSADRDHTAWTGTSDGSIKPTIKIWTDSDSSSEVTINCSDMNFEDVSSMSDVASVIASSINRAYSSYNPRFDVWYNETSNVFIVESLVPRFCILSVASGDTGTDVLSKMGWDTGTSIPATTLAPDQFYSNGSPNNVITGATHLITAPKNSYPTHVSLYRTKDLGLTAEEDGLASSTRENVFIHVGDYPLVNCFVGTVAQDADPYFVGGSTAYRLRPTTGSYSRGDHRNVAYDEDGNQFLIKDLDDTNSQYISSSGTVAAGKAYAVGTSKVWTGSQSGTTMTIESGSPQKSLTAADNGKPVWYADGKVRWIDTVLSSITAKMTTNETVASTAMAMDPSSRRVFDEVLDEILDEDYATALTPRANLHALPHRFHSELPNSDIGAVIPGWLFVSERDSSQYQYSDTSKKRHAGVYSPDAQFNDKISGSIQKFSYIGDYISVKTRFETWRVNTAITNELGNQELGENYDTFNDPELVDSTVGVESSGGIAVLENGNEIVLSSEPSVREFNAVEYGGNLAHERIQESDIQELDPYSVIIEYDKLSGAFIWGTRS